MGMLIVLLFLLSLLLWLIGLLSTKIRGLLLFFIKENKTKAKLTLVYLVGIPILLVIALIIFNNVDFDSKSDSTTSITKTVVKEKKERTYTDEEVKEYKEAGKILQRGHRFYEKKCKKCHRENKIYPSSSLSQSQAIKYFIKDKKSLADIHPDIKLSSIGRPFIEAYLTHYANNSGYIYDIEYYDDFDSIDLEVINLYKQEIDEYMKRNK